MNFTAQEIEILIDALNMAIASNKRMQTSKPKFKHVFDAIDTDLVALKVKLGKAENVRSNEAVSKKN